MMDQDEADDCGDDFGSLWGIVMIMEVNNDNDNDGLG